jgi:hypothetical protein
VSVSAEAVARHGDCDERSALLLWRLEEAKCRRLIAYYENLATRCLPLLMYDCSDGALQRGLIIELASSPSSSRSACFCGARGGGGCRGGGGGGGV